MTRRTIRPIRPICPKRVALSRLGILAFAVCAVLLGACATQPRLQGRSETLAAHSGRTLSAELPDRVRVPGVLAAVAGALEDRGYSIESRRVTADSGRIIARRPSAPAPERVVVRSRLTARAVGITITLEPFGDEVAARAILDDVLGRLGL
jgi:hypothetical protein